MSSSKEYVLVVDAEKVLVAAIGPFFDLSKVEFITVSDVAAAKRTLVERPPLLVVSRVQLPPDNDAGLRFSRDLKAHPLLSMTPVLLAEKTLTQELMDAGKSSGARAVLPIPLPAQLGSRVFSSLLPQVARTPAKMPERASSSSVPFASSGDEFEEKLQIAQQLLAKVLHNLKTSDLLRLSEKEDVPRVVNEITRSICGIDEKNVASKGEGVEVDLDSVFGGKKDS